MSFFLIPVAQAERARVTELAGDSSTAELVIESPGKSVINVQGEWRFVLKGFLKDSSLEISGDQNTIVTRKRGEIFIRTISNSAIHRFTLYGHTKEGRTFINSYEVTTIEDEHVTPTLFLKIGPTLLHYTQSGLPSVSDTAAMIDVEYRTPFFHGPFQFSLRGTDSFLTLKEDQNQLAIQNLHLAALSSFRLISNNAFSFGFGPSFSIDYTASSNKLVGYNPDPYPGLNAEAIIAFSSRNVFLARLNYGLIFSGVQISASQRDLRLELNYDHDSCFQRFSCLVGIEFSGLHYLIATGQELSFTTTQLKFGVGF